MIATADDGHAEPRDNSAVELGEIFPVEVREGSPPVQMIPNMLVARGRGRPPAVQQAPGRPRKRPCQTSAIATSPRCPLCGEEVHAIEGCIGYGMVRDARNENEHATRVGRQKRCKLCRAYGHEMAKCPLRTRYRTEYSI
jgi:hypothetical protein